MLGITPYASHPKLPTRELAKAIIRSMRGPSDYQIEHKYTRNLALLVSSHIHPQVLYICIQEHFTHLTLTCIMQRKFVRESSSATQRGKLHKLFKNWLSSTYPPEGVLTDSQWEDVMAEDASVRQVKPWHCGGTYSSDYLPQHPSPLLFPLHFYNMHSVTDAGNIDDLSYSYSPSSSGSSADV